jgi:hypothetical protein
VFFATQRGTILSLVAIQFFFRRHSRGTDLDQLFMPHGSMTCGRVLNYAVRDQLGNAVHVEEVIDFTESHDAACFL